MGGYIYRHEQQFDEKYRACTKIDAGTCISDQGNRFITCDSWIIDRLKKVYTWT